MENIKSRNIEIKKAETLKSSIGYQIDELYKSYGNLVDLIEELSERLLPLLNQAVMSKNTPDEDYKDESFSMVTKKLIELNFLLQGRNTALKSLIERLEI